MSDKTHAHTHIYISVQDQEYKINLAVERKLCFVSSVPATVADTQVKTVAQVRVHKGFLTVIAQQIVWFHHWS